MRFSRLTSLAAVPVSAEVRRISIAAGACCALLTGGLPFIGCEAGMVMGRVAPLPSLLAFAVHLAVAIVYGTFFSLAIVRSRAAWTAFSAAAATLAIYGVNIAAMHTWSIPRPASEMDAFAAHLIFGAAFTLLFKLAEIGAVEVTTPGAVLWDGKGSSGYAQHPPASRTQV